MTDVISDIQREREKEVRAAALLALRTKYGTMVGDLNAPRVQDAVAADDNAKLYILTGQKDWYDPSDEEKTRAIVEAFCASDVWVQRERASNNAAFGAESHTLFRSQNKTTDLISWERDGSLQQRLDSFHKERIASLG